MLSCKTSPLVLTKYYSQNPKVFGPTHWLCMIMYEHSDALKHFSNDSTSQKTRQIKNI